MAKYSRTRRAHSAVRKHVRKAGASAVTAAQAAHRATLARGHEHLVAKIPAYRKWHGYRHHGKVHILALGLYVAIGGALLFGVSSPAKAVSSWAQTDWSGGQGTNTTSQYSSVSNVDVATAGQASISKSTNAFTNPGFSDASSWDGINAAFNSTTKYSGAGALALTPAASSSDMLGTATNTAVTSTNAYRMAKADFNMDGKDDAVIAGGSSCTISVYISTGNGGFQTPTDYASECSGIDIVAGDVNGDGAPDIAVSYSSGAYFSVYINNGSGLSFTKNNYASPGSVACSIAMGDFNVDNRQDLVLICNGNTKFNVYLNSGSGTFPTNAQYNTAYGSSTPANLITLDFNGDGYTDIAQAYNANGCKWRIILNNGGSGFGTSADYAITGCGGSGYIAYGIGAGNLNGDQYQDVVISYKTGSTGVGGNNPYIATFMGTASGVPSGYTSYAAPSGIYSNEADIEVADLNQDGYGDVIASSPTTNQYAVYMNNGNGTLASEVDYSSGSLPVDMAAGDYNGDGKQDLVILNRTSQTLSLATNKYGGDAHTQIINLGETTQYSIEGYAYTTGAAVTSADAVLYANGSALTTSYAATATPGWYKLTADVTSVNAKSNYGIEAKPGRTVYVDDMNLYKYSSPGVLTSSIYSLGYGGNWGTLSYTISGTGTVEIRVRTGNDPGLSDGANFNTCPVIASGTDLTGQTCVNDNDKYVQYQATLIASAGQTPVLESISLEYSPWDVNTPITNASSTQMLRASGGSSVASNGWTNGASPYFSWSPGEDNVSGSGIKGYCLYLGQTLDSDPVTTKGLLGTSPLDTDGACQFAVIGEHIDLATSGYLATALSSSSQPYYLSIKAIDFANNVFTGGLEQFQFRFDNTAPQNPSYVSAPSQFVSNKQVTITWPTNGADAPADAQSGVAGLQYKIGSAGTWYGDNHSGAQDATDMVANDGNYVTQDPPDFDNLSEGNNTIYFRTWDIAGNVSTANVTGVIKINTLSPSAPQNVTPTPASNTLNSFSFDWLPPATYGGSVGNITYCYTINTLPTVNTCSFTAAGVTALPTGAYATQPGENTFYVVAKDESGNVNYAAYASAAFTANTSAPGIPLNTDVADISVKATSNWKLAIAWEQPSDVGAGVSQYHILRSVDGLSYNQIASTSGTSYVDTGLDAITYYYQIKACDSANNCGALSPVIHDKPTGKFTSAAGLVADPVVSGLSTRKVTISWSTDRDSDSRIQFGKSRGDYFATEVASSEQTTAHSIEINNLTSGTTYYARARWTDEDGNIGSSDEFTFSTSPAPTVKEVTNKQVGLGSATIQFTTKEASKVKILYGKSESFGGLQEVNTALKESTYSSVLTGLDDGTKYYYKLNTFDSEDNEYEGNVYSFTTPSRPRISNLRFEPVEGEPTSTQRVSWTTNVPATSEVSYSAQGQPAQEKLDSQLVTDHSAVILGLADDSTYSLVARSRDGQGNAAISETQTFRTALDTRAPKISDVVVKSAVRGSGSDARGQIIVSWQTDEPSTSQVSFGQGSQNGEYSSRTAEDAKLVTEHLVIISDLTPSKVYQVQALAKDRSGNQAKSLDQTTIVGKAPASIFDIVFKTLQGIFSFIK